MSNLKVSNYEKNRTVHKLDDDAIGKMNGFSSQADDETASQWLLTSLKLKILNQFLF